ncbi:hypothetical protein AMTRI_Chr01g132580 [Amborella trichopoda]
MTKMPIVLNRPHFVSDLMPKVPNHPYFVSDRMLSKSPIIGPPHFVSDRSYFVPDCMLSRGKVSNRLHFVLYHMLSKRYFGLHFTFLMT